MKKDVKVDSVEVETPEENVNNSEVCEKDLLQQAGELSASNQKLVWTTFLIGCFGRTRQELEYILTMLRDQGEQETFRFLRNSVLKGKPFPFETE